MNKPCPIGIETFHRKSGMHEYKMSDGSTRVMSIAEAKDLMEKNGYFPQLLGIPKFFKE